MNDVELNYYKSKSLENNNIKLQNDHINSKFPVS